MDPLITNAIDPALMRMPDKRGRDSDREPANRRRRPAVSGKLAEDREEREEEDSQVEGLAGERWADERQADETLADERQTDEERRDRDLQNQARLDDDLNPEPDAPRHLLDDLA